jgi:nucleoside 2-deoxyribosyltransferase
MSFNFISFSEEILNIIDNNYIKKVEDFIHYIKKGKNEKQEKQENDIEKQENDIENLKNTDHVIINIDSPKCSDIDSSKYSYIDLYYDIV